MLILYSGGCFAANAPSPYLPSTPGGQPMTPSSASYLPGTPGGQPMTPGTGGMDMMSPVLGKFVWQIWFFRLVLVSCTFSWSFLGLSIWLHNQTATL